MGGTTRRALGAANPDKPNPDTLRKRSIKFNKDSLSNGCMMRITPLIFWARNLDDATFVQVIREDIKLTHSSPVAQDAVIVYGLAIRSLIHNPGNRELAYKKARYNIVLTNIEITQIINAQIKLCLNG